MGIILLHVIPNLGNGPLGKLRILLFLKGQCDKGCRILVIILKRRVLIIFTALIIEFNGINTLNVFKTLCHDKRLIIGDVRKKDLCGTVSLELTVHYVHALPGLRLLRKVFCNVIFHLHIINTDKAVDHCKGKEQKESLPSVHDKCR